MTISPQARDQIIEECAAKLDAEIATLKDRCRNADETVSRAILIGRAQDYSSAADIIRSLKSSPAERDNGLTAQRTALSPAAAGKSRDDGIFLIEVERVGEQDRFTIWDAVNEHGFPGFYLSKMDAIAAIKEMCSRLSKGGDNV